MRSLIGGKFSAKVSHAWGGILPAPTIMAVDNIVSSIKEFNANLFLLFIYITTFVKYIFSIYKLYAYQFSR
ncbi:MAG: hypothetical protein OEZ01_03080 [Candidatus Heimdallarchaeota archaeon]|nr:hypothetical protein [Candidatus Heimdallarchaeota archaeon]